MIVRKSTKGANEPGVREADQSFRMGFGERLGGVIEEFDSRGEAAKVAGVVADQLSRYVRGQVKPPLEVVARLAGAKLISLDWLWSGRGARRLGDEPPEDISALVAVPFYDVRAGAGPAQMAESETQVGVLHFDPAWLQAHGIRPRGAKLVIAEGDSMFPTIGDGDPMLIDSTDTELRDKVFLLRRAGALMVKRLQRRSDGSVLLISDNTTYAVETLPRDEAEDLNIIGRVGIVLRSI